MRFFIALSFLTASAALAQPSLCDKSYEENGFYLSPYGETMDPKCQPTGWNFEKTVLFTFGWSLDQTKTVDLSNWLNASKESAEKAAAVIAKLAPDTTPVVVSWNYPGCFDLKLWPTSSICYSKPITLIILFPKQKSTTSQWTGNGYPLVAGLVANVLMRNGESGASAVLLREVEQARNSVKP